MDIKAYISSGILENFVFGAVSDQERREVQCLSTIYPEIKEEVHRLEQIVFKLSEKGAVAPADHVRVQLLESIKQVKQESNDDQHQIAPHTIQRDESSSTSWIGYASGIAALLAIAFGIFQWNQQHDLKNEIASLEGEKQVWQLSQEELDFIKNPSTEIFALNGTDNEPSAQAKIYWQRNSQTVYFQLLNGPQLASNEQLQLWAIDGDGPKSIGVIPVGTDPIELNKMLDTQVAAAFAVTIEPLGGSAAPTLDRMVLLGEV